MTKQEEQVFSNEFIFTRLIARIIRRNMNKSFIEISNLIVKELHSKGVVIKVDNGKDLTGCCIARIEPLIK